MFTSCIWMSLISFTYCTNTFNAFTWQAENSVLLKSLGWKPLDYFHIETSAIIEENFGMENFYLFEGDIIVDNIFGKDNSIDFKRRNLWPNGIIPYIITPKLNKYREVILSAMKYIENITCLQFIRRTEQRNYIRIYKGNSCSSRVGMAGGVQNISLGLGCYELGKIIHELFHAAGLGHEHSRSDRDDYIYINWDNIRPGHEANFKKKDPKDELLLTPYDYHSIMHYGPYAFSKNRTIGMKTIIPKIEGVTLEEAGEKVPSPSDIERIAILYNCTLPPHFQNYFPTGGWVVSALSFGLLPLGWNTDVGMNVRSGSKSTLSL